MLDKLETLLTEIDNKKAEINAKRPFSDKQLKNIKKAFDVDFTYNSNAIEGSTLTFSETKVILNEGLTIGGKKMSEHLEAINHKEAIDFIEELSKKNSISEKDIKDIHFLILKGIDSKYAGVYRDKPVGVQKSDGSIHHFTEPLKISEEMNDFIETINKNDCHSLIKAADAHYKFVTIHPFIDDNGRTARLLMNLILINAGYPPAIIQMSNRAQYILSIEKAQNEDCIDDFYLVIAQALLGSMGKYQELLEIEII